MTGTVNFPTLTLEEFLKRPETKGATLARAPDAEPIAGDEW